MEFEWDSDKSDACYSERGFDFEYVVQAFLDLLRCIAVDARFDYGEQGISCLAPLKTAFSSSLTPCVAMPFESLRPERPTTVR